MKNYLNTWSSLRVDIFRKHGITYQTYEEYRKFKRFWLDSYVTPRRILELSPKERLPHFEECVKKYFKPKTIQISKIYRR